MAKRNQLRVSTKHASHGHPLPVIRPSERPENTPSHELHVDEADGARSVADPVSMTRLRVTMTLSDEDERLPPPAEARKFREFSGD